MGRSQGLVLMLLAVAVVGHLTLGGRARWIAEHVMGAGPQDSTAKPASGTAPAAPASTLEYV